MSRKTSMPPEAANVCVVYCRVSSEKQATEDKGSLDAQERDGVRKAAELGLRVLYVVKDAESAWVLDKRSKFRQVLNDAMAGKFSVMIIDRMNRLTRSEDLSEYMQVMTELKLAGVTPVFVQRDYDRTPVGQFQQMVDAYVSAQEQANRRAQSLQGKRTRVHRDHHPIPGHHAPYGYRWIDERKTRLEKSGDEAQTITERIWHTFLTGAHPTLRGVSNALTADGVRAPYVYMGLDARRFRNRWNTETIRRMLHDPIYWGGPRTTFTHAVHNEPVVIPTYAPAYVSAADAARVHARLLTNTRYAKRNQKRDWGTLLHGGVVRCGECGTALEVHAHSRVRSDGSRLQVYRCSLNGRYGRGASGCGGVSLSTEALDFAVVETIDRDIARGHFLDRVFAAWDRDADSAHASVRNIETTLADLHEQISNGAAHLLRYAPGDPLAAPIEAQLRLLNESKPGLEERLRNAREAVATARNNPALRDELNQWFEAWMLGFRELPTDKQRDFLLAIGARVLLWREGEHLPSRAQLIIALPTSVDKLPPAPSTNTLDVEDDDLAAYQEYKRSGVTFVDENGRAPTPHPIGHQLILFPDSYRGRPPPGSDRRWRRDRRARGCR